MLFIEEARNKNFSRQLPASSKFATQADKATEEAAQSKSLLLEMFICRHT